MKSRNPKKIQTFEDFTGQYTSEYLKENYKEAVRSFISKETKEKNLKVEPPIIWKNRILGGFFTIEQYKAMANEAINSPLADRKGTINKMLEDYINKPLKQTTGSASKIYDNIRNNANHIFRGNKFLYYSNIIKIEELIKFEMYLLDHLHNKIQNPHFEFENKFDDVPESDVYKYFYEKLVNTRMLTEIEFHQYLKVAFEGEGTLKTKLVLKNSKGKRHERTIFNKYSTDIAGRSSKELNKYIGLLGDYFQGHDNKVTLYSNFNK